MILSVTNDLTDLMFLNELFSTGISDFNTKLFTPYLPQWPRRGQNPKKPGQAPPAKRVKIPPKSPQNF